MGLFNRIASLLGLEKAIPPSPPVRLSSIVPRLFKKGDSPTFDGLMKAVARIDITVVVDPSRLDSLGLEGTYDPVSNTITLKGIPDPAAKKEFYDLMRVLAHELFHAGMHAELIIKRLTEQDRRDFLEQSAVAKARQEYVEGELAREFDAEESALTAIKEAVKKDRAVSKSIQQLNVEKKLEEYKNEFRAQYTIRFTKRYGDYLSSSRLKYKPGNIEIIVPEKPKKRSPRTVPISITPRRRPTVVLPARWPRFDYTARTADKNRQAAERSARDNAQRIRLNQEILDRQRRSREQNERNNRAIADRRRQQLGQLADTLKRNGGFRSQVDAGRGYTGSQFHSGVSHKSGFVTKPDWKAGRIRPDHSSAGAHASIHKMRHGTSYGGGIFQNLFTPPTPSASTRRASDANRLYWEPRTRTWD